MPRQSPNQRRGPAASGDDIAVWLVRRADTGSNPGRDRDSAVDLAPNDRRSRAALMTDTDPASPLTAPV